MIIEFEDHYGTRHRMITTSKEIPPIGSKIETPKFSGRCTDIKYIFGHDFSCEIAIIVRDN